MSDGSERLSEVAPAKLNLALHVRGKLPDGRHAIETLFAFCLDGDIVEVEPNEHLILEILGPMAGHLDAGDDNLVMRAALALQERGQMRNGGAALTLDKRLPIASGIGGGSADAAATLRLLTRLWNIDPAHASAIAHTLGADVPACLLSMTARGDGAGDRLVLADDPDIAGTPVLLVNPRIALSTREVFAAWDGNDRGPLVGWREGRNDLETPARALVPQIGAVLDWLAAMPGAYFVRMSGSGATCFALFRDEDARDAAATACPSPWWKLASVLR
ncbi:MAG TPA: 4-(cytidine 5'-diphospho)-2-C-methyl-D-erythritol kinase [Sphingomicrobium sp.]|nr:4-(cytidine 5'-diphospho)-2-C-methyl-D-erythritol kinase [Sphingomicrobium sp.]